MTDAHCPQPAFGEPNRQGWQQADTEPLDNLAHMLLADAEAMPSCELWNRIEARLDAHDLNEALAPKPLWKQRWVYYACTAAAALLLLILPDKQPSESPLVVNGTAQIRNYAHAGEVLLEQFADTLKRLTPEVRAHSSSTSMMLAIQDGGFPSGFNAYANQLASKPNHKQLAKHDTKSMAVKTPLSAPIAEADTAPAKVTHPAQQVPNREQQRLAQQNNQENKKKTAPALEPSSPTRTHQPKPQFANQDLQPPKFVVGGKGVPVYGGSPWGSGFGQPATMFTGGGGGQVKTLGYSDR